MPPLPVSPRRILSAICAVAALGVLGPFSAAAAAVDPSPPPWLQVENGQTQPQFAFEDAI
jgi:hypothetical protein